MSTTRMSSGPAFTPEKDLARFEDTARRGQRLTGFSLAAHGWRFEDAEPGDVVFDMSYETDPDDHHFDLFRAAGWTPALTYGHIRLLKAAPGTTPVHTGTESRLEEALGNRALFLRYTAVTIAAVLLVVLAMAAADWPLAAVLATVAGLYVLSFTDLEWRGLIGWGLLLLGLAFHIVRFGLKPPSDPDRRR
ncbi:DUF2812 domain-containing protein [Micrococcus sp. UYEF12]|uniref:DUF2812 domain-containing protein n=1 Tax=Micrococcus sp. UYEF12 TaxID=1756388 RepID=UPI0033953EDC